MIHFFKTNTHDIFAVQSDNDLSAEAVGKLEWLFGDAKLMQVSSLEGNFVGPRREMITPWSTNAVEITQNMGISGIFRIESFSALPQTPSVEGSEIGRAHV